MRELLVFKTIGGCMRPLVKSGKYLFVEKISPNDFSRGDIVVYESDGNVFAHRIDKIYRGKTGHPKSFQIFDDAAVIESHEIPAEKIMGRAIPPFNGIAGLIWGKSFNFIYRNFRKLKNFFRIFFISCFLILLSYSCLPAATRIKTVEWNFGVGSSTGVLSGIIQPFPTINFRLPDAVSIKKAWLELEALSETNVDLAGVDIYFDQGTTAATMRDNIPNTTILYNTGESLRLSIKCEIPAGVFTNATVYNNYAAAAKLTCSAGDKFNMLTMKLYVTYEYDSTSAIQLNTVRFPLKSDRPNSIASVQGSVAPGLISFTYDAEIAEAGYANFVVQQQWFELRGHRLSAGSSADGTILARIGSNPSAPYMTLDGSLIDSYDFLYLTSTGSQSGFAVNTQQTVNIETTQNTIYNLGGECVVTYEFSKDAAAKTKTVYYLLGQGLAAGSAVQFPGINLFLEESGILLQALYAKVCGSFNGTTAGNVTWNYSVNGASGTIQAYSLATQAADIGCHPYFLDLWSASSTWTNGATVVAAYTPANAANTGVMGAELFVTYQYTSDEKFTDSYKTFAYQAGYGTITSTSIAFPIFTSAVENPEGRKVRNSGYLSGEFKVHKNKTTIDTGYTITQNINSVSAETHTPITSAEATHTTALYTDPLALLTTSNATLTTNLSASANNIFPNACANITYSYYPVPSSAAVMGQSKMDYSTTIPTGTWTNQPAIALNLEMFSRIPDTLSPVVEVKPMGTSFDGGNLSTGTAVNYSGSGVVLGTVTLTGLTDGTTYHWRAKAVSQNGSSLWSSFGNNAETEIDFGVDLSSPSVTLSSPLNASATNHLSIPFLWSGADYPAGSNSGVKNYTLELSTDSNFGSIAFSSLTVLSTVNCQLSTQNTYYWHVRAQDNAGNTGSWSSFSVIVDTTSPSTPILSAPLDASATNQMNLGFQWGECDDSGERGNSGINGYEFYLSTTSDFSVFTSSAFSVSPSLNRSIASSLYYWRVRAKDNTQNYGSWSSTWSVRVDSTAPPVPSLVSPLTDLATNYASMTFLWNTVSDALTGNSGIKAYEFRISTDANFSALAFSSVTVLSTVNCQLSIQNTYYWQVRSIDNAGNNSGWPGSYYLVFDTTVPNVYRNSKPDSQQPVVFRKSDPGSGSVNIDFEDTLSRLNELKYKVTSSPDGSGQAIIPWTLIVSSPANTSSYTDNWQINWEPLQEWATNYVHLYYSDRAGNYGYMYGQYDILKDTTPPSASTPVSPLDGSMTNSGGVSFDWTDAQDLRSGTSFYVMQVSTSSDFISVGYSSQTALSQSTIYNIAEKPYFWRIQTIDRANNYSAYSSTRAFLVDLSPPAITIGASLAGGDTTYRDANSGYYDIDFYDNGGSNLSKFEISASTSMGRAPTLLIDWTDSGINISGLQSYIIDWQISDFIWQALSSDATNYISIKTADLAGNASTYIDAFFIRKTSSSVSIAVNEQAGQDSVWRSTSTERSYDVDFIGSDSSKLQGIEYRACGQANGVDQIFDWTAIPGFSLPVSSTSEHWQIGENEFVQLYDGGTNYISVRCWNTAGTTITIKDAFFVKKDTSAPQLCQPVSPQNGSATNQLNVGFQWLDSQDLASGTTLYFIQVSTAQDFSYVAFSSYTSNTNVTSAVLAQSTYYWQIKSKDFANNWSEFSSAWPLQVDTTPPQAVTLSSPLTNFTTNYALQAFQWDPAADIGPAGMGSYLLNISTAPDFSIIYYSTNTGQASHTTTLALSATYYWNVRSVDRAQNFSIPSSTEAIIIDTAAPQAPALTAPLDNFATNNININFSWFADDAGPSGIKDFSLEVSTNTGFTPVFYSTTTELAFNSTNFTQGIYWWRVKARDNAQNYSAFSSTAAFVVDVSSPEAPVLSSPPDDARTNSLQIDFAWNNVSDFGPAGVKNYEMILSTDSGFGVIYFSSAPSNNSSQATFSQQNIFFWKTRCYDKAGNYSGYSSTYSITIDTTPPAVSNNQTGDDNWRADNSAVYDVDFLDGPGAYGSGLQSAFYRVYSSTTAQAGPAGTELVSYQTIFNKPLTERTSYYVSPDWSLSGSAWDKLNQGLNFVFVKSSDIASNLTESSAYVFYVKKDTAPPVIINNEPSPVWENTDRPRNADFRDNYSGVRIGSYTVFTQSNFGGGQAIPWTTIFDTSPAKSLWDNDWQVNFGLLAPGTNYVSVRSADSMGTIAVSTDVFTVLKDTITPQAVTNLIVSTGTYAASVKLKWTAPSDDILTDPGNTAVKNYLVKYKTTAFASRDDFLANGATHYQSWTPQAAGASEEYTVTGLVEGATYYFGIMAKDKANNYAALNSGSTNYFWTTRVAPSKITDLAGLSPDTLDPGSVELTWTSVGDDAKEGVASGYMLRYATYPFTEAQWNSVTEYVPAQSWIPMPSGSMEDHIVAGLSIATTYYFAIKALDDASPGANYSIMSNTVCVQSRPSGPADGMLCYGQGTLAYPRCYDTTSAGTSWTSGVNANNTAATIYWSVLRTCPVIRKEKMLGTLSSNGAIYTQKWDGQSLTWDTPSLKTTIATADAVYRTFDIAYEQASGRAMIVYRSAATGQIYYQVWSSTANAWVVPATTLNVGGTGLVQWVRIEPRPGTNEIMLVTLDANNDMFAHRWNGSSWANNSQLTLLNYSASYQSFDVAWENARGNCIILWAEAKDTKYAMWSSTASLWSTVGAAGPQIAALQGAYWIKLAADRSSGSNNIAMSSLDSGSDWNVSIWNGASWAAPTELTANMIAASPRVIDIAWEKDTGKCLAVGVISGQGYYVSYSAWTSASGWPAMTTYSGYDLGNSANLKWLQLGPDPNSNKMVLMGANAGAAGAVYLTPLNWTGSGWSGGSPLISNGSNNAYEFFMLSLDRHDSISPYFTDNQDGADAWLSANNGQYNVGFHDTGSSMLSKVQTQLSTAAAGAGIYRTWTDELTGLNANDYTSPWAMAPATWDQLKPGRTFVSLRVFDGVGNSSDLNDAFYILKDTQPPSIINVSAVSNTWYTDAVTPGRTANADFSDQANLSLMTTAQYMVYPQANMSGTRICDGTVFNYMANNLSSSSANVIISQANWNLLANGTNYVNLLCYDVAGNTSTLVDAFVILKDTVAPQTITTLQAVRGPYRGTIDLSWLAPGDDGALKNNSEGAYTIKYATYQITGALFDSASTYVQAMAPKNPSLLETISIQDLDANTTYYFAVKAKDKAALWSGISNSTGTLPRAENVYINEIYTAGSAGQDWIELYSNMPASFDLLGSSIVYNLGTIDSPGSESVITTWITSNNISSGTFKLISAIDLDGSASRHVKLIDNSGRTIDAVQWPVTSAGQSFARISDGNYDFFEIDPSTTMGYPNSISTGTIKINEVDYASSQQFAELYNTGTDTPTLTGWTLRNSNKNLFRFTRKIYPDSFSGIDFSSKDNNLKSWTDCFGAGGLNSAADFLVLENPSGQAVDRLTWRTAVNYAYYDHKAVPVTYNTAAQGNISSPQTIGRKPQEGSDTKNNVADFGPFSAPSYGSRNNNPSPANANTLNYPSSDHYLPRRFKIDLALGENSAGGSNDTAWFVRTGGANDNNSPHTYRLSDIGINLASLTAQSTVQAGLTFNDLEGHPLVDGAIYKMLLNSDNGSAAAPQITRNNLTYDASEHNVSALSVISNYVNNNTNAGLFKIVVNNQSPATANSLEISSVSVGFTDDADTALTTAQAKDLFGAISVVADNPALGTQGSYQSEIDTVTLAYVSSTAFSLDGNGSQVIAVANPDNPQCQISPQAAKTYFLAVYIATSSAVPASFKAKITPCTTGIVLRESISNVEQSVITAAEVITSSPAIVNPAPPPTGSEYPKSVTSAGNEIRGSVQINYSGNMAFAGASDGKVYALGNDGSAKWSFDAGSPVTAFYETYDYEPSSYVYVSTQSGLLYKLGYNESGYSQAWAGPKNLGSTITSDIIFGDNCIYLGTNDGKIHKILTSGADAGGWNNSPGISGGMTAIPVIDQYSAGVNALWFGTSNGTIYRLSNADATVTASSATASSIRTSPFLVAGYIDAVRNTHDIYFGDDAGFLRCRTSSNLTTKPAGWNDVNAGSPVRGSPLLDIFTNDYIYFGADNGTFYKVDASNGGINWTFQTGGPIRTVPVQGDNNDIYFGSDDGCLYGLNINNGHLLPKFPVVTGGEVRGSPFYDAYSAPKRIYFGSNDGKVYCVEVP